MTVEEAIDLALVLHRARKSGATFRMSDCLVPQSGYVVGRLGYEMRLHRDMCPVGLIREWLQQVRVVRETLFGNSWWEWTVGIWADGDYVYLDVGNLVMDREEAVRLGKERHQLAIYDLDKAECIDLR